jgi:hypothetical protein
MYSKSLVVHPVTTGNADNSGLAKYATITVKRINELKQQ